MAAAHKSADPDFENKWTYYGAADGSFSIYLGILWPRDKDDMGWLQLVSTLKL